MVKKAICKLFPSGWFHFRINDSIAVSSGLELVAPENQSSWYSISASLPNKLKLIPNITTSVLKRTIHLI